MNLPEWTPDDTRLFTIWVSSTGFFISVAFMLRFIIEVM